MSRHTGHSRMLVSSSDLSLSPATDDTVSKVAVDSVGSLNNRKEIYGVFFNESLTENLGLKL